MKEVTLYIPCYNAEPFIRRCLDSVMAQTYPLKEILVIDDGCTDKTLEIVKEYPRVKVIAHPQNKGLGAGRNTALNSVQTDYIANLDADCVAQPDWLEKLMEAMSDETLAGVGGRLIESFQSTVPDHWRTIHMKQHWGNQPCRNPDWIWGHSAVFKTAALRKAGGYNEKFRTNYEDIDISRKLRAAGYDLGYQPLAVVQHLRRDTVKSVLRTRWRWTALGVHGPVTAGEIIKNQGRNIGRSVKYMAQDIRHGRFSLLGLDFALGFYSVYMDFRSLKCR
jgi:glycosyltransferase involved in cell wall biosynthesis